MKIIKNSGQRNAIKEYLIHTDRHPSADDVYMNVRQTYPNISLGTVYRNLSFLAEQGEVLKIVCNDKIVRYDGRIEPHYHAECRMCSRVFDIFTDSIEHINHLAALSFNGIIEGHTLIFHGICKECLDKNNISSN